MEIKDILSLSDGNEYLVTSKAYYDKKEYLCLVDINNNHNIKFCYVDLDEIVIIKKEDIKEILLLKLAQNMVNGPIKDFFNY